MMNYFLYRCKAEGLLSLEELRSRHVKKDDLVKAEDSDVWVEACKVLELQNLIEDDVVAVSLPENDFAEVKEQNVAAPVARTSMFVNLRGFIWACLGATLLLLLLGSNPSKKEHYPVVRSMVEEGLNGCDIVVMRDPFMDMFFGGMGFYDDLTDRLMNGVKWHSAGLFSYCSFVDEDKDSHWVTLGILGHVYTLNQDAINDYIVKMLNPTPRKPKKEKQKHKEPIPEGGMAL